MFHLNPVIRHFAFPGLVGCRPVRKIMPFNSTYYMQKITSVRCWQFLNTQLWSRSQKFEFELNFSQHFFFQLFDLVWNYSFQFFPLPWLSFAKGLLGDIPKEKITHF